MSLRRCLLMYNFRVGDHPGIIPKTVSSPLNLRRNFRCSSAVSPGAARKLLVGPVRSRTRVFTTEHQGFR
jgi:hypothetical protein